MLLRRFGSLPAALAALWAAGACTAPQPECPRKYLEIAGGGIRPSADGGLVYDDSFGWSLGGGFDVNADPVVVSWELAGAWSQHDAFVSGAALEDDIDVWRVMTGLGARTRFETAPIGVHARAGFEWREESSDSGQIVTNDQWGTYVGFGVEFFYELNATLGPDVLFFYGGEDGLEETRVMLTARFY